MPSVFKLRAAKVRYGGQKYSPLGLHYAKPLRTPWPCDGARRGCGWGTVNPPARRAPAQGTPPPAGGLTGADACPCAFGSPPSGPSAAVRQRAQAAASGHTKRQPRARPGAARCPDRPSRLLGCWRSAAAPGDVVRRPPTHARRYNTARPAMLAHVGHIFGLACVRAALALRALP